MGPEPLFNRYLIFDVVRNQEAAVTKEVQAIPPNTLLNASEYDLIQAIAEKLRLEVPTINEEDIYISHSGETDVDVTHDPMRLFLDRSRPHYIKGTETVIAVPFQGDETFFAVQPQTFSLNLPRVEFGKGELLLRYVRTDQNGAAIRQEYQQTVNSIQEHLRSLSQSAAQFNGQLKNNIQMQIKARKERLLRDAGMTAAIGLPLKKRADAPITYTVPVKRRVPRIEQIKVNEAFVPEPALATEDYQEILRIMSYMVQVMELSPHAFVEMGEEDIRSHFLVQLNGAYSGQATGETFNFQGKTDILIREKGKNVFIAECKFWKGEKVFLATIDQLLSYLSWRDTKTAVVMFSRNADFSAVLSKIEESVPNHPYFKRSLGKTGETTFRYVFSQPNDANREIILTVLAFDVPTAPADIKAIAAGQSGPGLT